jgi:hypothetical protein
MMRIRRRKGLHHLAEPEPYRDAGSGANSSGLPHLESDGSSLETTVLLNFNMARYSKKMTQNEVPVVYYSFISHLQQFKS